MFDKLNAKYDPLKSAPLPSAPQPGGGLPPALPTTLSAWQDSGPVMRLSEYLKQHQSQGIKLYQSEDGKPSLCFVPGLGLADMKTERWQIALGAVELLQDAADDLNQLLTDGLIVLPTQPREIRAGPSRIF